MTWGLRRAGAAGLHFRLLLPVAVALIPAVGLMLALVDGQRRTAEREAREDAQAMAHLAAEVFERPFVEARGLLTGMAKLSAVHARDGASCSKLLADVIGSQTLYVNFGATSPDGRIFCSAVPIRAPLEAADRPWQRLALARRDFAVGGIHVGRITGKLTQVAAYPVLDEAGTPSGTVYASLDLRELGRRIAELPFDPDVSVTILDSHGIVLARRHDHERWLGRSMADRPVIARILGERRGFLEDVGLDGQRRLFAFEPLRGGWTAEPILAVASVPVSKVYADVNRVRARALVALGIVSALALLAALLVAELVIAGRIRRLADATHRVARGDLAVRSGIRHRSDDIGKLAEAFDLMAEALQRLTRRHQLILESSTEGICGLDPAGRITFANAAALRMLGREGDLAGQELHALVHASTEDGGHDPGDCPLVAPARHGGVLQAQRDLFVRADGSAVPIEYAAAPIRGEGAVLGVALFFANVTERERLQDQLRQAQKMEAVGNLAGGLAHDFNNLLSVILSCGSFLQGSLPPDDARREDVEEIVRAGHRASELTRQLLAYSRRQVLAPQLLDLNAVVDEAARLLRRLIGEDVDLAVRCAPGLPAVSADPVQLQQVILNLAVNARDAMPRGGRLTLETAAATDPEPPGRRVVLTVSDTGTGMDASVLAHVFEPFFTTKGRGRGTGLGLATAYGIVKQSGGDIAVESAPGKGSVFRVSLPAAEGSLPRPAAPADRARPGDETILVVEDEAAVRGLAIRALKDSGYRVLEASGASEALLVSERHAGPIHLLLTDLVMPKGSGQDLAARLLKARPDTRVLFMSGYSGDPIARGPSNGAAYLQKPFTPQSLTSRVREVLDGVGRGA